MYYDKTSLSAILLIFLFALGGSIVVGLAPLWYWMCTPDIMHDNGLGFGLSFIGTFISMGGIGSGTGGK